MKPSALRTRVVATRRWLESWQTPIPDRVSTDAAGVAAFAPESFVGVFASTSAFFPAATPLGANRVARTGQRDRWASRILEATPRAVVFSGYAPGYVALIESLRARDRKLRIVALWHGNPLQHAEPENADGLEAYLGLLERGCLDALGAFHPGLADTLSSLGWRCAALRNFASGPVDGPIASKAPSDGHTHVGVWAADRSWRKNPHAAVAGVARLDGAVLHGVFDPSAVAWAHRLGVHTGYISDRPLSRELLHRRLARTHATLHVSLAECSALLPLESLSLGVPCVVGPSGDPFLDGSPSGEALRKTLVVTATDDPRAIAAALCRAVRERDAVVSHYREWAANNERAARAAMRRLVLAEPAGAR